jgi:FeS assembly SUF system regulator
VGAAARPAAIGARRRLNPALRQLGLEARKPYNFGTLSGPRHLMLRVTKLTDYATVVLTALAARPDAVVSAAELAERAGLEMPTVAKLLKPLAQAGLVDAFRGTNGGYRLARAASQISLVEIVEAMEGPLGMTECSVHAGACGIEDSCGVRANWRRINEVVADALRSVTLAQMLDTPSPPPSTSRKTIAATLTVA